MKGMALGLNAASPPSAALHLRFCGFPPSSLMVINGSSIPIYSSTERYASVFPSRHHKIMEVVLSIPCLI